MFSFKLKFKSSKSTSLVIKDHVIRFATINRSDLTEPIDFGEKFLPPGLIRDGKILDRERLLFILEQCVDEWGLKKKEIHFVIPDSYVFFRKMEIPKTVKQEEIKGYLFMELGSSIPLPFSNPVFDFYLLEEVSEEQQILLFAAPEEMVQEYRSLLEEAKLTPISMEINSLAMCRMIMELDLVIPSVHSMLIEFDTHAVSVSIFQNHKPKYVHHLVNASHLEQFEINHLTEGEKLEFIGDEMLLLSDIQDTISEIERIMNFYKYSLYKGEEEVTTLFLAGDHPYLTHIYHQMKESLQLNLFSSSHLLEEAGIQVPPSFLSTMGLALKEVKS